MRTSLTIYHYSEDLRLVVSKEHDLASRDSVTMAELKNEDFILFNEDFYLNDKIIAETKMQVFSQIRFQMSRNGTLLSICSAFSCKYLTRDTTCSKQYQVLRLRILE